VSETRSQAVIVILLLGAVLAWMILDAAGASNPVRDYTSDLLAPVQYAVRRLVRPVARVADGARSVSELEAELEAAREEIAELRSQIVLLQEAQIENEFLRRELDFKNSATEGRIMAAEVIGEDTDGYLRYLIIDRGESDGIRPFMPVVTSQGLVGRIVQTSNSSSKVMLITDPSSSVSARIQRTRDTGTVQGMLGGGLVMKYIPPEEPVIPGDVVLTSGLGGNFPSRLPIGQVVSVRQTDVDVFQEALLVPAVDLRSLEAVSVLLSFIPVDEWEDEGS